MTGVRAAARTSHNTLLSEYSTKHYYDTTSTTILSISPPLWHVATVVGWTATGPRFKSCPGHLSLVGMFYD